MSALIVALCLLCAGGQPSGARETEPLTWRPAPAREAGMCGLPEDSALFWNALVCGNHRGSVPVFAVPGAYR